MRSAGAGFNVHHEDFSRAFGEVLRDPVWGSIFLSPALARLSSSEPFAKLGRIRQLGPAFLVYPGATHSRLSHSLGVYHIALRMMRSLAARRDPGFITREGFYSFLTAALCHDLGHYPYAHSLKELPLAAHETIAALLMLQEPLRSLIAACGADPEFAAAIVDPGLPDHGSAELRFFRGLLSGSLDPDKLDYLTRDAFFCGVPYGVQDIDFILQRLALSDDGRLAIEERGIMSVEALLFSKYLMYRSVYWHRDLRAATAMIKKALLVAFSESLLRAEELYGLDDEGFYAKLRGLAFVRRGGRSAGELVSSVFAGSLYKPLLDMAFDESRAGHRRVLELSSRLGLEEELALRAGAIKPGSQGPGPLDLVIDLPEPLGFETELAVLPEGGGPAMPFIGSSTIFKPPLIADFSRSPRRLRVFAAKDWPALAQAAAEFFA